MKKSIFFLLITALFFNAFAQTPQAFKYQLIARDVSGNVLSNQNVGLRLSILEGSDTGASVYTETWDINTNQFGLISLNIGEGTSGDNFSIIDWGSNNYFLKIEIDENGGTNYTETGTSQLLSVPYALYSNASANGTSQWLNNGTDIYYDGGNVGIGTNIPNRKFVIKAETDTDTLFEIQDKFGNPIMVITPQLAKFNILNSGKSVSGGFAVGRYTAAKDGKAYTDTTLLVVTPDSTRVYTSGTASKGVSGGFAVGRYTSAKGKSVIKKYFYSDLDSTRVYTDGSGKKGVAGGFAVGRYSAAKDGSGNYMYMVPDNYFIGDQSGEALQNSTYTGKYNTFFGYQTGLNDTSGGNNVFIGYKSGLNNTGDGGGTLGSRNVFLGYEAGFNNTNGADNVLLGYRAGHEVTTAGNNISIGSDAGYRNTNNSDNIFLGRESGYNHTGTGAANSANNNIYLGYRAGYGNAVGDYGENNIFMGTESGLNNISGYNNVTIGYQTGHENTTGFDNVFLGNKSGFNNKTARSNVFIGNNAGFSNEGTTTTYDGNANVFIGDSAGYHSLNGYTNVFVGFNAGNKNVLGHSNIFFGYQSGYENNDGNNNLYLGYQSGRDMVDGNSNTFLGNNAGVNATGGENNIFIGPLAGRYQSIGNNNIYLGNSAGSGQNLTSTNQGTENVFIGTNTGKNNTTGEKNVFLGYLAGDSNTSGESNVFIGTNTGEKNTYGYHNVFLGNNAGVNNVSGNYIVCIGDSAGYRNTTSYSTFVGEGAGRNNTSGQRNTFLGRRAGYDNETGMQNTYVGYDAGTNNTGEFNTMVGYWAGGNNVTGNNNVFIGRRAGQGTSGSDNVFIGHFAGEFAAGSNKLYIANSSTSTPLIYGEFDNSLLRVNGTFHVGTAYSLPTSAGINGQVLVTQGNGAQAVWASASTLDDGDWVISGNNMYSEVSGNVGIGTITPGAKLHVSGGDLLIGSDAINTELFTGLKLQYNTSGEGAIMSSYNDGFGFLTFYTKESLGNPITERMRIDKNGNVGIGTITPGAKLHVKQVIGNVGIRTEHHNTADYWETGVGTNSLNYKFLYNSTIVADIDHSTGSYNVLSDKRLKTDISEMKNVIEKVKKLKPVYYRYKTAPHNKLSMGFIAQDVEVLFPESVSRFEDSDSGIIYKGLRYDDFGVIAVKAIQEQQQQIEQQKAENNKQNKKIQDLEIQIQELKQLIQNK